MDRGEGRGIHAFLLQPHHVPDALFGFVGSAQRRQLMVQGAPVNRAARLMTAVSGDVLCDAPTERASRAAFAFEQRGTLQLDGLGDVAVRMGGRDRMIAGRAPCCGGGRVTGRPLPP